MYYLPIVSSEAGSCLTALNWQEAGIKTLTYYLDVLLLKPGIEVLSQIKDVSSYLGWPGSLVLNASNLVANKQGVFVITSPYDGSRVTVTYPELFAVVLALKPAVFIFPKHSLCDYPQVWEHWSDDITPVVHASAFLEGVCPASCSLYLHQDASMNILLEELKKQHHPPLYVSGTFSAAELALLARQGMDYIETDEPAKAGLQGLVFVNSQSVDLKDSNKSRHFEVMDPSCLCSACSQGLTQAYLHHLFQHTPLLAQRFLIQHNVYQSQNWFHSFTLD